MGVLLIVLGSVNRKQGTIFLAPFPAHCVPIRIFFFFSFYTHIFRLQMRRTVKLN